MIVVYNLPNDSRHLRMRKIELSRWWKIAADLGNNSEWLGDSKLGISNMGNSADVISANTHAFAWQCMAKFANFTFAPNFYLCTDSFETRSRDADRPSGSPIKIWEESRRGTEVTNFRSYPIISLWEIGRGRATCWLSGVASSCESFYKEDSNFTGVAKTLYREKFHPVRGPCQNTFQPISQPLYILSSTRPPGLTALGDHFKSWHSK